MTTLTPEGLEHTAALGDGNFASRIMPDSDMSSRLGRGHVSAIADAWADESNFSGVRFDKNEANLTEVEHENAVCEFLKMGGQIKKVDQGASSGLVLGVQKSKIRYGKSKETYVR